MNDNLITEIIDLNKVKANIQQVQKMWEQLITTMAAKSGKDLKFDDLAKNLKTVTAAEKELAAVKKTALSVEKELDKKLKAVDKQRAAESKKRIADAKKQAAEIEKAAQKEALAAEKAAQKVKNDQVNAQKALQRQREKGLSVMAKGEAKERQLAAAAQMEAKSDADLNAKLKAQITLRSRINKETPKGIAQYKKMTAEIDKTKAALGKTTKSTAKLSGGMTAAAAGGIAAAIAAFRKIAAAVKESISLFIEQEKQSFRVRDAFGDYAGRINAAANANQSLTTVGNEQYQKLAVLASSFGISNDKVNESVMASIGLATKFESAGLSQETALKNLALARNGEFTQLQRYIPELKNLASNEEKLAYIQEQATLGYQTAAKYTETYGGRLEQIKNVAGDLKETIGEGLLKGLFSVDNKSDEAINKINEALQKTNALVKVNRVLRDMLKTIAEPFISLFKLLGDGGDTADGFGKVIDGVAVSLKLSTLPVNLLFKAIKFLVEMVKNTINAFKNIKNLKFEDVFNIIKKSIADLISPITDLLGLEDQVNKFFGVQQEQLKLTAEEYEKLNVLSENYVENVRNAVKEQIKLNEQEKESILDKEKQEKALEAANKRYQSYLDAIRKANEEAKLSIKLGGGQLEARRKELEAIYSATKAYVELNGYTENEIEQLKELRSEINKLNAEIESAPKLINKQDVENIESIADLTSEVSMNMRDITPAVNESADGFTKLEQIGAKLQNTFNDLFGATEPIEDWRDTFKESITEVVDESMALYNTVLDMQNEKFNEELDNVNTIYDKQVEGLESTYDRRKELLEATIDDEEELAAALERIEEEKTAVQGKFQDEKFAKEAEIARKQAILEKKKVAMEVAAGSATALVEAVKLIGIATTAAAPGDPYSLVARIAAALAASLTVVGAVITGIAKVKAIDIPQFWSGGEAQEGQLISVAERGNELAVGESGQSYMFDKQSVLVAPEKMRIFSNKETKQIMEKQTINNTYEKSNNVNLTVSIDNERHKKYFKLN